MNGLESRACAAQLVCVSDPVSAVGIVEFDMAGMEPYNSTTRISSRPMEYSSAKCSAGEAKLTRLADRAAFRFLQNLSMFLFIRSQTLGCVRVPSMQPSASKLKHGDFLRMTEPGLVGRLKLGELDVQLRRIFMRFTECLL